MRVGIVARSDTDMALDQASTLHDLGISVSLYLSYEHTIRTLDNSIEPINQLYQKGIISAGSSARIFHFPRMRNPRSFAVIREIHRALRDDEVDLVHILMAPGEVWLAALACLISDIPVISTMIVPQPNINDSPFVIPLYKLLAIGSKVIIVHGQSHVELVHKLYGLPESRVVYIPLGMGSTFRRWGGADIQEEEGTILFFGRADPHKGLENLIRAQPLISSAVPDARFLIVAHGDELVRCRSLIVDASKYEIHDGYVSGQVGATHFGRSSLVALPYLSAATSGVLLTAYAFGKPVVASRVGCLPEYVKDGSTGYLVPPSDIEKLATAIIDLLKDLKLRKDMGTAAKHWVQKERLRMGRRLLDVYENALAPKDTHYS